MTCWDLNMAVKRQVLHDNNNLLEIRQQHIILCMFRALCVQVIMEMVLCEIHYDEKGLCVRHYDGNGLCERLYD